MILLQFNESNSNRRNVFVQMVDAVDRVTPKTGLSLSVQMVKPNGSAYAACGASVMEVGAGTYQVQLATGDLDIAGMSMLKITATGAAVQYVPLQVLKLFEEVHLVKAALANDRSHVIETGIDYIRDDDGCTVLRTLTPGEEDGVVYVTAS